MRVVPLITWTRTTRPRRCASSRGPHVSPRRARRRPDRASRTSSCRRACRLRPRTSVGRRHPTSWTTARGRRPPPPESRRPAGGSRQLFTAVPESAVARSKDRAHRVGEVSDDLIAGGMTTSVVDPLEVIEIEEDHDVVQDKAMQCGRESPTVAEPGEVIGVSVVDELVDARREHVGPGRKQLPDNDPDRDHDRRPDGRHGSRCGLAEVPRRRHYRDDHRADASTEAEADIDEHQGEEAGIGTARSGERLCDPDDRHDHERRVDEEPGRRYWRVGADESEQHR